MSKRLLERARRAGHPLIDAGRRSHFCGRGMARQHLIDDLHDWEEQPQKLTRLSPRLWACSFDLPLDAYFEYAYLDPVTKQHLPDPLNTRRVNNGLGGTNHFFYMPDASPSPSHPETTGHSARKPDHPHR